MLCESSPRDPLVAFNMHAFISTCTIHCHLASNMYGLVQTEAHARGDGLRARAVHHRVCSISSKWHFISNRLSQALHSDNVVGNIKVALNSRWGTAWAEPTLLAAAAAATSPPPAWPSLPAPPTHRLCMQLV